jgi:16S rRNA (guanine527-N7)-methyltransferase
MGGYKWFAELVTSRLPVPLSKDQLNTLYGHFEMLMRWNQKLNLTSIRDPEEVVIRHYCECLLFAAGLPAEAGNSVVDVGSGAGFPGVPIAVLRPDCGVTLLESHRRKGVFLEESTRGIGNISVLVARAEAIQVTFDWVVSRAVRAEAVVSLIPALGSNIGLMISDVDFQRVRENSVVWAKNEPIPWSRHQLCAYGHVSRGTMD